jgi:hypothetical protein
LELGSRSYFGEVEFPKLMNRRVTDLREKESIMSKGEELLKAIKSMRDFLGDVSLLLRSADALMAEKSWETLGGSGCLSDMSYSVNAGHLWMPREASRSYRNSSEYPNIVAMVAVLLDDFQRDYRVTEPVVSASYFIFPVDTSEKITKLELWQSGWFGWLEAQRNGAPVEMDDKCREWEEENRWKYMQVFGRPLVEVNNEALLKEMIIDPLLRLIEQHHKKYGRRGEKGRGSGLES